MTNPQKKAVELLAVGTPVTEVAKEVNRSRNTIYEWLKQPEFKAELDRLAEERLGNVRKALIRAGPTAVETLLEIVQNGASESAQVRAAEIILRYQTGLESNEAPQVGVLVPELRKKLKDLGFLG